MMFAVLGYQVGNADVQAALARRAAAPAPGGLFFCDFWYGPAVLAQRPSERVKVIDTPSGARSSASPPASSTRAATCARCGYHVWRIEDGQLTAEVREQHPMRYFFAPELDAFLLSGRLRACSASARSRTWTTSPPNNLERGARRASVSS